MTAGRPPVSRPDVEARIAVHLAEHPGLNANAIGGALGVHPSTIRRALERMSKDGRVTRLVARRSDSDPRSLTTWRLP